jgi:hypothetical protein
MIVLPQNELFALGLFATSVVEQNHAREIALCQEN